MSLLFSKAAHPFNLQGFYRVGVFFDICILAQIIGNTTTERINSYLEDFTYCGEVFSESKRSNKNT